MQPQAQDAALPARQAHGLGPRPLAVAVTLAMALAVAAGLVPAVAGLDRVAIVLWVTVPLLALVWLHPAFGAGLLVGYASLLAFLIRMLPANTGPIGLALDALIVVLGARLLLACASGEVRVRLRTPLTALVLGFMAFQALEVFNPAAPSVMFGAYGLRVTIRMLGFFVALYALKDMAQVRRFMGALVAMFLAMAAYGIFQHHHGLLWQEMHWLLTEGNAKTHILQGYVRVFSTVGDAATFGFLMMAGALWLMALGLAAKGVRAVALFALALPLLYAMTVSYSRGPVVGLVAGVAALILASRNWKLAALSGVTGAAGLALLLASGGTQLVDRLGTAADPNDASFQTRLGYITTYLPEIAKRPLGYGINTSGASGLNVTGGETIRNTVIGVPTDNYYFKVALEMGFFGFALFVLTLGAILFFAYRAYRSAVTPTAKALALGIFASLAALSVGAFSNDIFAQKPIAELLWLLAGVSIRIAQLEGAAWAFGSLRAPARRQEVPA